MAGGKAIKVLPIEPLARSGVGVLAGRWAQCLRELGWEVGLHRAPILGHAGRAVARVLAHANTSGATVLILGLPADVAQAQSIIDALVASSGRAILLWDRTGHAPEQSALGLSGLDRLCECWVLNPLFRSKLVRLMPHTRIELAPLAIPGLFFESRYPSVTRERRAVYLGRFSASKRARLLAERWVEEVWPLTGLPLVLAGRGMADGADDRAIARLERGHPGMTSVRLMSEKERASFLASASLAVFPAEADYLPQALAETVAVGTSVLATDIEGHRPIAPPAVVATALDHDLLNLPEAVLDVLERPQAAFERSQLGRELLREVHSMEASGRALSRLMAVI